MKPKKEVNKVLIGFIIFIVIILVAVGLFVGSLFKDKSDSKKAMKVIRKDYKDFTNEVVEFNNYRDKIYDEVFADAYYESFSNKFQEFNTTFEEYEKTVDKIVKNSKNLSKYCVGIYYTDADVNTMCKTFNSDYETLYNSFVTDVKNYNTLIKEFNAYIEENKIEASKLTKYETDKKYKDFNKDKKYSGKE